MILFDYSFWYYDTNWRDLTVIASCIISAVFIYSFIWSIYTNYKPSSRIRYLIYTLVACLISFFITMGTIEYHNINYRMYIADQYILYGDYNYGVYMYEELLHDYPGLQRVIDNYSSIKKGDR